MFGNGFGASTCNSQTLHYKHLIKNGKGPSDYNVITVNHTGTGISYTEILADIAVRQYSWGKTHKNIGKVSE